MKKLPYLLILILTVIILISCDSARVYEENMKVPDQIWSNSNAMIFSPEITDSTDIYNVFINVRNSGNYSFSNLFLFITTTSPSGQWIKDTLEIPLANNRGKWLGNGVGYIYFNRQIFKENVQFPVTGVYSFEIVQGMRETDLKGIRDVGLRIEKSE